MNKANPWSSDGYNLREIVKNNSDIEDLLKRARRVSLF